MKLYEILSVLSPETEVGVWNIDAQYSKRKYCKQPTRQTYCKVKNLKWGDICNILKFDVMCVNVLKDGVLIRVYDKERLEKSLAYSELAKEIKRRF